MRAFQQTIRTRTTADQIISLIGAKIFCIIHIDQTESMLGPHNIGTTSFTCMATARVGSTNLDRKLLVAIDCTT